MYGSWVRIPAGSLAKNSVSVTDFFCLRGEIGRHAILRGWFPKDVLVRVQSQAQQQKLTMNIGGINNSDYFIEKPFNYQF